MARPISGSQPLDKRLPLQITETMREQIEEIALTETGGNSSRWVRDRVEDALIGLPIYGAACCGSGKPIEAQPPITIFRTMQDVFPEVPNGQIRPSGHHYGIVAEGDSMNNATDKKLDIQNDDVVVFKESPDAQNGQIVHYEIKDEWDNRVCGIRFWRMSAEGEVTLRAGNDAQFPGGARLYPDIVRPRDDIEVRGIFTNIVIRGARL